MLTGWGSGGDGAIHFASQRVVGPLEVLSVALRRWQHEERDRSRRLLGIFQLSLALRRAVVVAPREVRGRRAADALLHLGVHISRVERVRSHTGPVELERK